MTRHPHLRRILGVAVVLVAAAFGNARAAATENPQASIQPTTGSGEVRPFFILDLTPGSTVTDSVTVVNKTADTLTFDLYAADAFNDESGGFVLRRAEDPKKGIGAWVQLPFDHITVRPATSIDIPFSVDVPDNAPPGDHAGGIVALARNPEPTDPGDESVRVQIRNGVGARIYGRVSGPTHTGLEITRMSVQTHGGWRSIVGLPTAGTVIAQVTNTGNVRLVPSVELDVEGVLGFGGQTVDQQLKELLPGQSATVEQQLDDALPPGRSTVRLTATAQDATARRSTTVWQIPWLLVALVALVVGLAIRNARDRRARRKDGAEAQVSGEAEAEVSGEAEAGASGDAEAEVSGEAEAEAGASGDAEADAEVSGDAEAEAEVSGEAEAEAGASGDAEAEAEVSGAADAEAPAGPPPSPSG